MIANLIGGFVSILIGVSLIGPISTEVNTEFNTLNTTGGTCINNGANPNTLAGNATANADCQVYLATPWGATVGKMVPGFFALGILGIGIAITYSSLRQAGIV